MNLVLVFLAQPLQLVFNFMKSVQVLPAQPLQFGGSISLHQSQYFWANPYNWEAQFHEISLSILNPNLTVGVLNFMKFAQFHEICHSISELTLAIGWLNFMKSVQVFLA